MSIDERIKQELENTVQDFDDLTADKDGLMNMVSGSFKGGMGRWVFFVAIFTLIASGFLLWTGYRFFTAVEISEQVFWGICLLISLFAQVALKQWTWMEMSRSSLMREIKRIEVAVIRLSAKMERES